MYMYVLLMSESEQKKTSELKKEEWNNETDIVFLPQFHCTWQCTLSHQWKYDGWVKSPVTTAKCIWKTITTLTGINGIGRSVRAITELINHTFFYMKTTIINYKYVFRNSQAYMLHHNMLGTILIFWILMPENVGWPNSLSSTGTVQPLLCVMVVEANTDGATL